MISFVLFRTWVLYEHEAFEQGVEDFFSHMGVFIESPVSHVVYVCLQQKCLRRIYSGLREYQLYLPYVERENLTKAHMMEIKSGITRLLHLIKETGKVSDYKTHTHRTEGTELLCCVDTIKQSHHLDKFLVRSTEVAGTFLH